MQPLRSTVLLPALLALAPPSRADSVTLEADKDNTLYESPTGALSNGAGERLFAGVTDTGMLRRALIHFDLSSIPPGVVVTNVTLDMQVSKVPFLPPSTDLDLHRVSADWGEGASDAPGEEGTGDPTQPGDASWVHTFFPTDLWTNLGGDFVANVSATTKWSGGVGPISWSSAGLLADVLGWLDDPGGNFGWVIKAADEGEPRNAKRFNSREFLGDPTTRPLLTIEFDRGIPACGDRVYCDASPDNAADIGIDTCSCSSGSINVSMTGAPTGVFGYLLVGAGSRTVADPPGAMGDLCLAGGPIGRFKDDIGLTDASGSLTTDILNAVSGGGGGNIPTIGGNFCTPVGQTWNFQYWHRSGNSSRFSKALSVTFN